MVVTLLCSWQDCGGRRTGAPRAPASCLKHDLFGKPAAIFFRIMLLGGGWIMRRVIAIAVAGYSVAGCSSFSLDSFKPTPPTVQIQLESTPPGADAWAGVQDALRGRGARAG